MILSNTFPNMAWDQAMGTTRFPPESWRGGGGGLGRYGDAQSAAVMTDVLEAFNRAIASTKAQAYLSPTLPDADRQAALMSLQRAESQMPLLEANAQQPVGTWIGQAQSIGSDISSAGLAVGADLTDWLKGILSGAQTSATGARTGLPVWALAGGAAAALLMVRKLLK